MASGKPRAHVWISPLLPRGRTGPYNGGLPAYFPQFAPPLWPLRGFPKDRSCRVPTRQSTIDGSRPLDRQAATRENHYAWSNTTFSLSLNAQFLLLVLVASAAFGGRRDPPTSASIRAIPWASTRRGLGSDGRLSGQESRQATDRLSASRRFQRRSPPERARRPVGQRQGRQRRGTSRSYTEEAIASDITCQWKVRVWDTRRPGRV